MKWLRPTLRVRLRETGSTNVLRTRVASEEICPRGNNKVVIYISLYHDKCLLFMLELY